MKIVNKFLNLNHCTMSNNTGLALSEVRGPLNNLTDNLSGEHGAYWLTALKKMLRKEELPELPIDVREMINKLNARDIAEDKIETWVNLFKMIPSVSHVRICNDPAEDDFIMDVYVYTCLADFLRNLGEEYDGSSLFMIKGDFSVKKLRDQTLVTDKVYDDWNKDTFPDLSTFTKALLELGEKYRDSIPLAIGRLFTKEQLEKLETPLEDLDMSVRAFNLLKKCNIRNLTELVALSENELSTKFFTFEKPAVVKRITAELSMILNEKGLSFIEKN